MFGLFQKKLQKSLLSHFSNILHAPEPEASGGEEEIRELQKVSFCSGCPVVHSVSSVAFFGRFRNSICRQYAIVN